MLRRRSRILIILVALIGTDVILANVPGPVPTDQAISSVEHDQSFVSVVMDRVFNGIVVNGTYSYVGYSNDPARDFACVNSLYSQWGHYLNPFHQYTTTTLSFAAEFEKTSPNYNRLYVLVLLSIFVQVNPTTGQIYSIQQSPICA